MSPFTNHEIIFNTRASGVCCFLFVVMASYAILLFQSYFYVTEVTQFRYRLVYYRKTVWRVIQNRGIQGGVFPDLCIMVFDQYVCIFCVFLSFVYF